MVVVEAMEVVGDPDRVDRNRMRRTPLRCLQHDGRKLGESLDQLPLLRRKLVRHGCRVRCFARVADDSGDARVRVLHVVDRIFLRPLRGEVDVDVDRLIVAARDEIPARCVDADPVDQLA